LVIERSSNIWAEGLKVQGVDYEGIRIRFDSASNVIKVRNRHLLVVVAC
jgi:hypothetical protein